MPPIWAVGFGALSAPMDQESSIPPLPPLKKMEATHMIVTRFGGRRLRVCGRSSLELSQISLCVGKMVPRRRKTYQRWAVLEARGRQSLALAIGGVLKQLAISLAGAPAIVLWVFEASPRLFGWFVGLLVAWLPWLIAWLVCWLVGWLVCWLVAAQVRIHAEKEGFPRSSLREIRLLKRLRRFDPNPQTRFRFEFVDFNVDPRFSSSPVLLLEGCPW